jgi:hypothetical protein
MTSPESCCAAGFATVSDIGGHYNTAYGQSIPLVKLCVVKGQRLKKCRKLSKTRLIFFVRNLQDKLWSRNYILLLWMAKCLLLIIRTVIIYSQENDLHMDFYILNRYYFMDLSVLITVIYNTWKINTENITIPKMLYSDYGFLLQRHFGYLMLILKQRQWELFW